MDINKVSITQPIYSETAKKKTAETGPQISKRDKLDISEEAKALGHTGSKKLDEIRAKIDSKFYEQKEILDKVADKILKELTDK
jgi:hypothetical protein